MKVGLSIIVLAIIIAVVVWSIQPKEVRESVTETINKSLSSIINKTKEVQSPTKENVTKETINETKVKEIEESVSNISKIKGIYDKPAIEENLKIEDYAPIIVEVNDSNKINEILLALGNEFKLKRISTSPPPTFSGNITISGLQKLEKNVYVTRIYFAFPLKPTLQDSIPLINANDVWNIRLNTLNITGNTTVCIIDSGINYAHPDLGGCFGSGCKVVAGYNFLDDNTNINDTSGHGTKVAGIVAANGSIKGVAPNAKIIMHKVLGTGSTPDMAKDAINWCINNGETYNISTISMSFGVGNPPINYNTSCDDADLVVIAANNASTFGIFVDASSGNNGNKSRITSPACGSNVTSVGATYDKAGMSVDWSEANCTDYPTEVDQIACGSNRAPFLDLLAPGAKINSTYLWPWNYAEDWGTSFAAPHVAGVATLMKQANSSLSPAEIENILKKTGRPVYDSVTGLIFPRIDAYKAVLSAYNKLVVTDLNLLYENVSEKVFEFKVFNNNNATNNVTWKLNLTENILSSNVNITLDPYEELFVYAKYNYSSFGNYQVTAFANSTLGNSNSEQITVTFGKPNLRVSNLTTIYNSSTRRIFEFTIDNNETAPATDVYWRLNVSNETGTNSTIPIIAASGEKVFVYVDYNYTTPSPHNVTAIVDPDDSINEVSNEDNSITITDP